MSAPGGEDLLGVGRLVGVGVQCPLGDGCLVVGDGSAAGAGVGAPLLLAGDGRGGGVVLSSGGFSGGPLPADDIGGAAGDEQDPVVVQPDAVDEHPVELARSGAGRGDEDLPAPGGAASEGSVVAVAQLDLAGAGGDPGDEQREVGGPLALRSRSSTGPEAGRGAGRGCGGGVAGGALPALRAGGGASGLPHRGTADRTQPGPGGTGSHRLHDRPRVSTTRPDYRLEPESPRLSGVIPTQSQI